ncbi:MAG: DUF732 domain-containing protein [Cyanobacteria bacterium P01_A01_bin.123]
MTLTQSLTALASGVMVATAMISPALAQDPSVDEEYLASLYEIMGSIEAEYDPLWMATEFLSPEENVEYAQLICQGFEDGMTPDDILNSAIGGLIDNPDLPRERLEDAAYYAGASIPIGTYYYCPDYFSVVEDWLNQ